MNFGIRITLGVSVSTSTGQGLPQGALTLGSQPLTLGGEVLAL